MSEEPAVTKPGMSTEMILMIAAGVGFSIYAFQRIARKAGEEEATKQVNDKIDELKEAVGFGGGPP